MLKNRTVYKLAGIIIPCIIFVSPSSPIILANSKLEDGAIFSIPFSLLILPFLLFWSVTKNVMFGPRVSIIGGNHLFGIQGKRPRFLKPNADQRFEQIVIEEDVWCGANVTILKGVKIGCGAIIGAGSVVTKDIPPYTIAVGNPCKVIGKIFNQAILEEHLRLLRYSNTNIESIIQEQNKYV